MRRFIFFILIPFLIGVVLAVAFLMAQKDAPIPLVLRQFQPKPGDVVPLVIEENGQRKYYK